MSDRSVQSEKCRITFSCSLCLYQASKLGQEDTGAIFLVAAAHLTSPVARCLLYLGRWTEHAWSGKCDTRKVGLCRESGGHLGQLLFVPCSPLPSRYALHGSSPERVQLAAAGCLREPMVSPHLYKSTRFSR